LIAEPLGAGWYLLLFGIDGPCNTISVKTSHPMQGRTKIILDSLFFLSCVIRLNLIKCLKENERQLWTINEIISIMRGQQILAETYSTSQVYLHKRDRTNPLHFKWLATAYLLSHKTQDTWSSVVLYVISAEHIIYFSTSVEKKKIGREEIQY
jgi:hypothetical protein